MYVCMYVCMYVYKLFSSLVEASYYPRRFPIKETERQKFVKPKGECLWYSQKLRKVSTSPWRKREYPGENHHLTLSH